MTRPVPIESLCRSAGIALVEKRLDWPRGHLAAYVDEDSDCPTLVVNAGMPLERRRFAAAHALEHYWRRHSPRQCDPKRAYRLSNTDLAERQANRGALIALLPKGRIDALIRDEGVTNVKEIAKRMQVSEAAVHCRLFELGWLG